MSGMIIVGGIPEPIGGVTTYLRRLLHRDTARIEALLDFYPGPKEPVRADCADRVIMLRGKAGLLAWLWTRGARQSGREVFFNFSTPRGLVLPLLARKPAGARWSLMLHHGALRADGAAERAVLRRALLRFDEIRALSDAQRDFYAAMGVPGVRVTAGSSYCEPADHVDDPEALALLAGLRRDWPHVAVMSGFPRALYNFELGIEALAASGRGDCALCLFIYGPGELRDRLAALARRHPWLHLYDGRSERFFNTILRHSDLLLRLTETDSSGISVLDAAHWGRRIIASDVCVRPEGTVLTALTREAVAAALDRMIPAAVGEREVSIPANPSALPSESAE